MSWTLFSVAMIMEDMVAAGVRHQRTGIVDVILAAGARRTQLYGTNNAWSVIVNRFM